LENPTITQQELSGKVFKDNASVTRIIDLLVKADLLQRQISRTDRRRTNLKVTKEGLKIISKVQNVVTKNRETALNGISKTDLGNVKKVMHSIIENCSK
jgi:MarR family transcriptional regulator, transcriptional regulator for hemolysin